MAVLDLATLRVMFALIALLLFVLVMSVQHGRPRTAYGRWWALAMLLYVISAATYLLEDVGQLTAALAGGRFLLVAGTQCFWASVLSLSRPVRGFWLLPLPLVTLASTTLGDTSADRWAGGAVFFASMAVVLGGTAHALLKLPPGFRKLQAAMAYGMIAGATFYLGRLVALFLEGPTSELLRTFLGPAPATVLMILLVVVATFSMTVQSSELDAHTLETRATHDDLTGLLNRQGFLEVARPELERLGRHQLPGALILVDLDHFKAINDTYGHPAGDVVLATFAETARSHVRASDLFGRYGGEEFVILLSGVSPIEATEITDAIGQACAGVRTTDGVPLPTASFGIAATDAVDRADSDLADLIKAADEALYRAKNNGRNQSAIA